MFNSSQLRSLILGQWRSATAALRRPTTSAFWVFLAVGFALRIVIVNSSVYQMDSDTSVVYLMARHIARGEFSPFFWGQSYGGAILQWTAGIVMLVVGPSIIVLAVVSALFWAAAAIVLRSILFRSHGRPAGDLVGVLFWFSCSAILTVSVRDPGFYGPTLLFGLLAIRTALSWRSERPVRSWVLLGALAGLNLWTSPIAVAFMAPAAVLAMFEDRRRRMWLWAALAALVTSSAWLINLVTSRGSAVKPLGGLSIHPESLLTMFTTMIPSAFPGGDSLVGRGVVGLLAVLGVVALLVRGVRTRNRTVLLFGAATVAVIGVLVLGTGVRLGQDSFRYTAFLVPGLAVSATLLLRRRRWLVVLGGATAVALTFTSVFVRPEGFRLTTQWYDPGLVTISEYLTDHGVHSGYGSYWAAYSLTAVTDERVTLAALSPRRYAGYEVDARDRAPEAFVVYLDNTNDRLLRSTPGLPSHTRTVFGGYVVYLFDDWFDPYRLKVGLY